VPRKPFPALAVALVALVGGAAAATVATLPLKPLSVLGHLRAAPAPGPTGPEGAPIPDAPELAPAASPGLGQSIDGIKCQRTEQVLFHIHARLTIFVQGKARQVPFGIGIGPPLRGDNTAAGPFVTSGSCFSWLHTHAADGIIHIESPVQRTYTLGNFFDIWHEPLGPSRVGPARGHVTALFNGRYYAGNPRAIPLLAHAQIQLEVGKPLLAPEKITFPNGL
jgi:hypothetical protein